MGSRLVAGRGRRRGKKCQVRSVKRVNDALTAFLQCLTLANKSGLNSPANFYTGDF